MHIKKSFPAFLFMSSFCLQNCGVNETRQLEGPSRTKNIVGEIHEIKEDFSRYDVNVEYRQVGDQIVEKKMY